MEVIKGLNSSVFTREPPNPLDKPDFNEVFSSQMHINYAPFKNLFNNSVEFGDELQDPNWTPEIIQETLSTQDRAYLPFANYLHQTKNIKHYNILKNQIDEYQDNRKVLHQAGTMQILGANLLDPINLAAVPIGGPISSSFLKQGVKSSFSAMTPVVAVELGDHWLDPTRTTQETAMNIGSGLAFTFVIGGLFSIPVARRQKVVDQMEVDMRTYINDVDSVDAEVRSNIGNRQNRPYAKFSNTQLTTELEVRQKNLEVINTFISNQESFKGKPFKRSGSEPYDPEFVEIAKSLRVSTVGSEEGWEELLTGTFANMVKVAKKQKTILEKQIGEYSGELTARRIEEFESGQDIWRYKDSWFTDSPFFKLVTTPAKRIFQNKKLKGASNFVKKVGVDLFGDKGVTHAANELNISSGNSVHALAAVSRGEWVAVYDDLIKLYGDYSGQPVSRVMDVQIGRKKDMASFITEANRKRIFGEKTSNEAESKAIQLMEDYYQRWEKRLVESGVITKGSELVKAIGKVKLRITELEDSVSKSTDTPKTESFLKQIEEQKLELDRLQKEQSATIISDEVFFPRYWNQDYIRKNRQKLFNILFNWFKDNPEHWVFNKATKKYEAVTSSTKKQDITKRVDEAIDNILGIKDVTDVDNMFLGRGISGHLKFRALDVPNKLVYDFIENDPIQVMRTYNQRIAPKYHLWEKFGTTDKRELFNTLRFEMVRNGVDKKTENAVIKDFDALFRRVTGTALENPDTMSQKARRFLTETAQLTYLGTAGLASITDFAKIAMEHNMGDIFKVLFNIVDNQKILLNAKEARIAGEILEILMADSHLRFSENVINNPFMHSITDKALAKVRNTFFFANFLAPLTNIAKRMDAMVRVHSTIDMAVRVKNTGKLPKQDIVKMNRYGLDYETLLEIANAPYEKTSNGLYLANTEAWLDSGISKNTLTKFRVSLNQGIQNTIMLGTPADKPIAVDGVFYLPIKLASKFGYKEDDVVKGYARIENGLGALPFQFYSYSFAATNKISAAFAHGAVKNRVVAVIASMGLGYMGLSLKNYNRSWVMDNMSTQDKIARSFDMSGLAALYSDMFYTLGGMVKDGFDKDMMGVLGLKRKGPDGNMLDATTSLTGAGTSWALDAGRVLKEFYDGNWTEGAKNTLKISPFQNTIFLRDDFSAFGRMIEKSRF